MDLILEKLDKYFLTPYVYSRDWPEDDWKRQLLSLFLFINAAAWLLYIIAASLSYVFLYDHRLLHHPLILKDQIRREVTISTFSIPFMAFPTSLIFLLEVRSYSKLYWYDRPQQTWSNLLMEVGFSVALFLFFTDSLIYWIHRGLHQKNVYKYLHKTHHLWKVPTPFASHAFHPLDGFLLSVPYHIYPFLFPLHKIVYLGLFLAVNVWTVTIHDGDYRVPDMLKPFVNGSAHHTDHHLFYNYNYGQFFTLWDRIGGTFRTPCAYIGQAPIDLIKKQNVPKEE